MTRSTRARLAFLSIPVAAALPMLAACGDQADDATANDAADAPAAGINATVTPSDNLAQGDVLTVELTGLDPEIGYYTGICAPQYREGNPVPDCTGDRTVQGTQAWITNKDGGTATITPDGTAKFDLTVATQGEAVNCLEQECAVKIFGDHSEGFHQILDVPVTFAK